MVDFDTEDGVIYWTGETTGATLVDGSCYSQIIAFSIDVIPSYALGNDFVSFDTPESWELGETIRLNARVEGIFRYEDDSGWLYDAVRAETPSHVILTGNYREPDAKGMFILVLPKTY